MYDDPRNNHRTQPEDSSYGHAAEGPRNYVGDPFLQQNKGGPAAPVSVQLAQLHQRCNYLEQQLKGAHELLEHQRMENDRRFEELYQRLQPENMDATLGRMVRL